MQKSQSLEREIDRLFSELNKSSLPADLREKASQMVEQLRLSWEIGDFIENFQKVKSYVDWIVNLPWQKESKDILDLKYAEDVLDKNHYGLKEVKNRILEYLSVLILQKKRNPLEKVRAPILCFVGLVGTGKTTIASSIAESMGRKLVRIPFGGLGDPLYLRGQSKVHPESEPGQVIKGLRWAGAKNVVMLLDEIDRVADEALNTIMGVLVELLDPEQNSRFTDYFVDYPFDLSSVLFIATANNTRRIATAVLDRLEPIQMPSYTDEEKIAIGSRYIFPKVLKETGLTSKELIIANSTWPQIVRPLGYDAGVRTLKRTIEGICRKVARLIVEGKGTTFRLTPENVKDFLPSW
jgi:ATP-dependent Lon protease